MQLMMSLSTAAFIKGVSSWSFGWVVVVLLYILVYRHRKRGSHKSWEDYQQQRKHNR
jgi:hypothetical protein